MRDYPEHEKLQAISKQSQLCGEFLEWLQEKYYLIDKKEGQDSNYIQLGYSSYINVKNLLAEYFDIDANILEEEKREMLEELKSITA